MDFVLPAPPQPTVAVADSAQRFPVRRIFCVGRNYAAHAREMGKDPDREPPFFFCKPADAVVDDGEEVALNHVWGYGAGNDLTRRDLQLAARDQGRPWDFGKAFDRSAVIGPIHSVAKIGHLSRGAIRLTVNGAAKQKGDLADLIWSVPEIIAYLSRSVTLAADNLIMTGTPAGVGPLLPGDVCVVSIEGLGEVTTRIGPKA